MFSCPRPLRRGSRETVKFNELYKVIYCYAADNELSYDTAIWLLRLSIQKLEADKDNVVVKH